VGDVVGEGTSRVERFHPTNGRVTGILGLLAVAVLVLLPVVDRDVDYPLWAWPAFGLAAVLLWAAMLRPAVRVEGERLVMRNMLDTVEVPLAGIDTVSVRQFVVVRIGDKRYVGTGVSRTRRQGFRDDRKPAGEVTDLSYGGWVENRLWELTDTARRDRGIRPASEEQGALAAEVRRQPAWLEIGLLAGLVVALAAAAGIGA